MLELSIHRNGSDMTLELPIPIEVLAGELRTFGIDITLCRIEQNEFALRPLDKLGEHFMKLIKPENTLQAIAVYSRELDILAGESRQALTDLIMADRFRDLDHMDDYLKHGPAALTHLVRLKLGNHYVDLPADNLAQQLAAAGLNRSPRQIRLGEMGYLPLNDQGRELMEKCSPYESLATTNLTCFLLRAPDIDASMHEVMKSAHRLLSPMPTEPMNFYCPLTVREEDENDNLVEGDPFLLREHEDVISDMIRNEMVQPNDNMARHMGRCSQLLRDKVASAEWDVGRVGGDIYGIIRCELYVPLTAEEKTELANWIRSQNFDGFGESVEQTPIETTDGNIYVSFGGSDPGYFVYDQEQFGVYLNGGMPEMETEPAPDQGFGGIGGMA